MSFHVEISLQVIEGHLLSTRSIDSVKRESNLCLSVLVQFASKSVMKFLYVDLPCIISVKIFVKSLKLSWRKLMSVHLHSPLELLSFQSSISYQIHFSKLYTKLSHTIYASLDKSS